MDSQSISLYHEPKQAIEIKKGMMESPAKTRPNLSDIPETMLWTLHNRAAEAMREDARLHDPKCLDVYRAIDYDYVRYFGKPDFSHAGRSMVFDRAVRAFLKLHPDGVIVNLGEGLETQRFRVPTQKALWISVDIPDAMAFRELFIKPDDTHLHVAKSALDTAWFDAVPENRAVFITAQGLLMYFHEEEVFALIRALAARFPGQTLMFDYINRKTSKVTTRPKGFMQTPDYRVPPFPWGIDRKNVEPAFKRLLGEGVLVENIPFEFPRGKWRYLLPVLERLPVINQMLPGVCRVRFP